MPTAAPPDTAWPLDTARCRAARRVAAVSGGPWLHQEVARRMAERLAFIRTDPGTVHEWRLVDDGSAAALRERYPRAGHVVVGPWPLPAPAAARRAWWPRRAPVAPTTPDALAPGSAGLLWCNLGWPLLAEPAQTLAAWHRMVRVGGFLMFSTFGPDTLRELRGVHAGAGWGPAHAPFEDMHDLGDRLVAAGFADPVMDQEHLTLTFASAAALRAELRGLGSNTHANRFAGCRGRHWQGALDAALSSTAGADGRLPLTIEIVYGHAFRAADRVPVAAETTVSLARMRDLLAGSAPH
jgi:malonyl-CoA O-methyltransferase